MPLQLDLTPPIRDLLSSASMDIDPSKTSIEWSIVKDAASIVRGRGEDVSLAEVCEGSSLVLTAPAKREVSEEFRKELESRRRAAEQAQYDALVRDVTPHETQAQINSSILPTTKLQLGQGIHMVVSMGLGYALGRQFGAAFSGSHPVLEQLGGVLGIIIALIFETVLLMTRMSMDANGGAKYAHLIDAEKATKQAQKPTPSGKPFTTTPSSKLTALGRASGKRKEE